MENRSAAPSAAAPEPSPQAAPADAAGDPRHNVALFERFARAMERNDTAALGELIADDYVEHAADATGGRAGLERFFAELHAAVSDLAVETSGVLANRTKVAGTTRVTARHTGVLFGVPPTGRRIVVTSIDMFRVEGGRLAEHWDVFDDVGVLAQLGAS
jgi:steroid delta-isomerase-like uncharacterized protein